MLLASIRFGLLLGTLVASLQVAAAPRFWTLTGVQLADGAIATGYFSYDDATATIANWNLRFSGGAGSFTPHTYVPGNSTSNVTGGPHYLQFFSIDVDPRFVGFIGARRDVWIRPLAPLDGNSATVSIDVSIYTSGEYFEDHDFYAIESRDMTAGSLVLSVLPPPATIVQVDEFYHSGLGQYFITADPVEKQLLDNGAIAGWERTDLSFKAYATGSSADGSINPVCRYYSRDLISHFYSASLGECYKVLEKFSLVWSLESDNVFQINLPDKTSGACPAGTIPVYRLLNQRDSNHRYTTSTAIRTQMLAAGFRAEGYGPDGVVMCAVQ